VEEEELEIEAEEELIWWKLTKGSQTQPTALRHSQLPKPQLARI